MNHAPYRANHGEYAMMTSWPPLSFRGKCLPHKFLGIVYRATMNTVVSLLGFMGQMPNPQIFLDSCLLSRPSWRTQNAYTTIFVDRDPLLYTLSILGANACPTHFGGSWSPIAFHG